MPARWTLAEVLTFARGRSQAGGPVVCLIVRATDSVRPLQSLRLLATTLRNKANYGDAAALALPLNQVRALTSASWLDE